MSFTTLVISMDTPLGAKRRARMQIRCDHWVRGVTYEEAPEHVQTKMGAMHNCSEQKRRNRAAVFAAHLRALQYVVDHNIHDAVILEDDATVCTNPTLSPSDLPDDDACLLSGLVAEPRNWQRNARWLKEEAPGVLASLAHGVNEIDYERYRWHGQLAMYYPTPEVAARYIRYLCEPKRYTYNDMMLSKQRHPKYLLYPSAYDNDDGGVSQNNDHAGLIQNYVKVGKVPVAPPPPAPIDALRVRLLRPGAAAPKRASDGAAGYDVHLCADEPLRIAPGGWTVAPTGIAIAIPPGTYARVAPRSGLAVRHALGVGAGVVDEDYRGEVGVVLINHGDQPIALDPGSRIAQIVLERIATPSVYVVDDLDATARGDGGFGSTGT